MTTQLFQYKPEGGGGGGGAHSIEEKIQALQEAKRELADSIIGSEGGSIMNMSAAELLELLS